MKRHTLNTILGVVVMTLACTVGTGIPPVATQAQGDQVATVVAATMQALGSATPASTQVQGVPVSLQHASFIIPEGLASGADPKLIAAVAEGEGEPWGVAPEHLAFTLTGYTLQARFHEPRIFVYPAQPYAQTQPTAAEQIDRLQKILAGFTPLKETLPNVPFFNAGPLIAANIKLVPFQTGKGVRALTQYAQYSAPVNNRELFYHFQGMTSDNQYYVIAILPITAPLLPQDEKPEAVIPEGGVPLPADTGPTEVYYFSVTEKLNTLPPEEFTPTLDTLDSLVGSILITSP